MTGRLGVRYRWLARDLGLAMIGGLWIGSVLFAIQRIPSVYMGDFLTYWAGASRLLAALPLYPAFQLDGPFFLEGAAWGIGYVYPPTAALLSAPLGLLSEVHAFALFTAMCGLGLGLVVFQIGRSEGLRGPIAFALSLFVLLSGPAIDSLSTGNANSVAAVALGATWMAPRASGYLAVVGAMIKLYPGLGFVWTLRSHAPIIGPVVLGLVVAGVSLIWPGPGAWFDFARTYSNGQAHPFVFIQPPRNVLEPLIGPLWAALVAYGLTAVLLAIAWRHRSDHVAFLVLSVAMIMPAPVWYFHYYLIPVVGGVPWVAFRLAARTGLGSRPLAAVPSTSRGPGLSIR